MMKSFQLFRSWFRANLGRYLNTRGSVLVMTAVGMVFIIGLTAMVTDVGWLYYNKSRLQGAVNAGWKAGYDRMMELGFPLTDDKKTQIKQRVQEVLIQNGYAAADVANIDVKFPNGNTLEVVDNKNVGLFFAQVVSSGPASVGANRVDIAGPGGAPPLIPLGIPWGVTKDVSSTTYRVDFFESGESGYGTSTGFLASNVYILKLGSGLPNTPIDNATPSLILIPMDNAQTQIVKAYGVAYWCLRIVKVNAGDDANDQGFEFPKLPISGSPGQYYEAHEGIEWLLGYRGGAFLLPYKNGLPSPHTKEYPEILSKIEAEGVDKVIITGNASISALYAAAGYNHILKIDRPRPRIAVYSSQSSFDPVENCLIEAKIPFGGHPHQRALSATYATASLDHIYDGEIVGTPGVANSGELQRSQNGESVYTWLHCHHEDFTGFTGGCQNMHRDCKNFDSNIKTLSKANASTTEMCSYCAGYYFPPGGVGWSGTISYVNAECYRRKKLITNCRAYNITYTNDGTIANPPKEICPTCDPFYQAAPFGWPAGAYPLTKTLTTTTNYTYPSAGAYASCTKYVSNSNRNCKTRWSVYSSTNWCAGCKYFYNLAPVGLGSVPLTKTVTTTTTKTYPTDYSACWLNAGTPSTCQTWDNAQALNKTASTSTDLCPYCRSYYFYGGASNWNSKTKPTYTSKNCLNYARRCADRETIDGIPYCELSSYSTKICRNDAERPQCRSYKAAWDLATSKGYTDHPSYSRSNIRAVDSSGNLLSAGGLAADAANPVIPADSPIILNASRVQKMKYDVVANIRKHVTDGGYLFTQCFALETLSMGLWHRRIFLDRLTGADATGNAAYADCLGFRNFGHDAFLFSYQSSGAISGQRYSTINAHREGTFRLLDQYDPRCQSFGDDPSMGTGHADSMNVAALKTGSEAVVLGDYSDETTKCNYVKGKAGDGEFCYMGGHGYNNIQAKRLVLNNVLLGAFAEKRIDERPYVKQKYNYGVIDPTNNMTSAPDATLARDYKFEKQFMYGFDRPLETSDYVNPNPGNKASSTTDIIGLRVASGGMRVILPITDVPPTVANPSNTLNATATSIYDIEGWDASSGQYRPASATFQASVRIIGFAEFELLPDDPNATDARIGNAIAEGDVGDLGPYMAGQIRGRFIRYIIKPGEMPLD